MLCKMDQKLELKQEVVGEEATASTSVPLAPVKDEPAVREPVPFSKQEDVVENIAMDRRDPLGSPACHSKELRAGNEQPTDTEGKHLHCKIPSKDLLPQSVEGPPIGKESISTLSPRSNVEGQKIPATENSNHNEHMLTHRGDEPFRCKGCNTSFSTKSKLKRHLRTHCGERKFFCNQCGGSFWGNTNFVRHMKVHSRGRPFQCPECPLTFPTKKSMRRHKFSHSRDRTFDCNE